MEGDRSLDDNASDAYTRYQQRVDEQLRGIDFDKLTDMMQKSLDNLDKAKGKKSVLLVGRTGAGKSTLLNALKNLEMQQIRKSGLRKVVRVAQGQQEYAKIGENDYRSETQYPLVVPFEGDSDELCLCDMPGTHDSRGRDEELCSTISTALVAANSEVQGIVVVIDCTDLLGKAAGEGVTALLKVLSGILRAPEALIDITDSAKSQLLYVFTKVPSDVDQDDIVEELKNRRDDLLNVSLPAAEKKLKNITEEINRLTGIQPLQTNQASSEQMQKYQQQCAEQIAKLPDHQQRRLGDLNDLLQENFKQYFEVQLCIKMYEAMAKNHRNIYLMRYSGNDSKLELQKAISGMRTLKPIEPSQFQVANHGSGESSWALFQEVSARIAQRGDLLLSKLEVHDIQMDALRKHKASIRQLRGEDKRKLQIINDNLRERKLRYFRRELLSETESLIGKYEVEHSDISMKLTSLKSEIRKLNTDEPCQYKPKCLSPSIMDLLICKVYSVNFLEFNDSSSCL